MFRSDMHESQNSVLDIVDMDTESLKDMLMHMYTLQPINLSYK